VSVQANGRTPVIVDALRSPVGRAHKGALAAVRPDDLAAHVVRELLARNPGIDPATVDDVVCGCAFPWGEQGYNVRRCIALLARRWARCSCRWGSRRSWSPTTGITRAEMDRFAQRSQERAVRAREGGVSAREIVPVPLPDGGSLESDESPRANAPGRSSPS
jgi:acetyl-CoA acetyltransferase